MRAPRALLLVVSAVAPAGAEDIDSETFRPTPAVAAEAFHLEPADVGTSGEWTATSFVSHAANPMTIETRLDGATLAAERPVTRRTTLELGGAYAFGGRFEAGLRAPFHLQGGDSVDNSSFRVPAADGFALGDISVHGRARMTRSPVLTVSGGLHVTLPTSTDGQFVGVDGPTARVLALATWRAAPGLSVLANVGGVLRATSTYRNSDEVPGGAIEVAQGSGVAWGAGASMRATDNLRVTAELFGEVISGGEMGDASTPIDALLGIRYQLANGLTVGAALGRGVTAAIGTPEVRGVLTLTFTPSLRRVDAAYAGDEDIDDVGPPADPNSLRAISAGSRDKCPTQDEDVDGFEDEDGCPDPDNDADAIADANDKCPDRAETINGIEDNDGCPDQGTGTAVAVGSQSATEAADQTFKQGRELMKAKSYAKACAAFEASQRLDPQFGTQFNLAGCYIELGKLATAWAMYRELARVDKNAERRAQASEAATKVAARVPKLQLTTNISPQGMHVFMNGNDANPLIGLETPVDFGTYEIVAGAPNHRSWRKTVTVNEEGKVTKIRIQLEPIK